MPLNSSKIYINESTLSNGNIKIKIAMGNCNSVADKCSCCYLVSFNGTALLVGLNIKALYIYILRHLYVMYLANKTGQNQ